jgi:hypothetical protein
MKTKGCMLILNSELPLFKNRKAYKLIYDNHNNILPGDRKVAERLFHALSPRYDSSEECRVSFSLILGAVYK